MIFRMAVHLPNTDVRQLSNSMRTLITDTNVQQMMPAGSSNSLVLIGTGQFLADTVSMFLAIDAAAGQSHAAPSESSDE